MGIAARRTRRISKIEKVMASFPCSAGILPALLTLPKCCARFSVEPLLANQLFRVLPSSNIMGAERKLERASRWVKKGASRWNHSGQHSGWLATTPAEHGCLSNALQFLIANLELEFELSPKRISNLKISNRKFMTIFQSENWAASEFRRYRRPNFWKTTARSPEFLIGTFDISEITLTPQKTQT